MAPYEQGMGEVQLGLADLGVVTVRPDAITVSGPDAAARECLWDRLGDWALGQWHLANGRIVVRGAAVAREGHGVVLTGSSRCGASVTALVMCTRGWSLVSDGIVVIDVSGVILARAPEVVADTDAVAPLPASMPRRALRTGSPRTAVSVPGAPSTAMTDLVRVHPWPGAGLMDVRAIPSDVSLDDAVVSGMVATSMVARPLRLADVPRPRAWRALRPAGATEESGRAGHPLRVAEAIEQAIGSAP